MVHWLFVVLLWTSLQISVDGTPKTEDDSVNCYGNEISEPVVTKTAGCIDKPYLDSIVSSQLFNTYNMTVLTEEERGHLVMDRVLHMITKLQKIYDKRVIKAKNATLKFFEELSKAKVSVLLAMYMEFKQDHHNLFEKTWYDAVVVQNWGAAISELKGMRGQTSEEKTIKRLTDSINLLENDDNLSCCPGEMYEGHCYILNKESYGLDNARKACDEKSRTIVDSLARLTSQDVKNYDIHFGDLVSVHCKNVSQIVERFAQEAGNSNLWVGAFKCSTKKGDSFIWTDGDDVKKVEKKKYWAEGADETEGECTMFSGTEIIPCSCEEKLPYVCEIPMPFGSKADVEIDKQELKAIKKKARRTNQALKPIIEDCKTGANFTSCDTRTSPHVNPSEQQKRKKRKAVHTGTFPDILWLNHRVPYVIEESLFTNAENANITTAIGTITQDTCLTMVEISKENLEFPYLMISRNLFDTTGCWGDIGIADPGGASYINLGTGCTYVGTIQHELLHILGFVHEHSRPDRDDYVQILLDNVKPGFEDNFYKYSTNIIQTLGHGYDYQSIMHYGVYSLSAYGSPTILPTRPFEIDIGQRIYMTRNDMAMVNRLYECEVPVDGDWDNWGHWGECDKFCGGGVRKRVRSCILPVPQNGGDECYGSNEEFEECNTDICSVDYQWAGCWMYPTVGYMFNLNGFLALHDIDGNSTDFKSFCSFEASQFGSTYFAIRNTTCYAYTLGVNDAPSDLFLEASDNCVNRRGSIDSVDVFFLGDGDMQAYYGPWQEFSLCTVTCSGGTKTHTKVCNNPPPRESSDDFPCEGEDEETVPCNENPCPVNGVWGEWSEWGGCSLTCGVGQKVRTRECDNPPPENGGLECETMFGTDLDSTVCNTGNCPAVEGCPVIKPTGTAQELFEQYLFNQIDICKDGGIGGLVSQLKRHNPEAGLDIKEGVVTFDAHQKLIGEFPPDNQPCLFEPGMCLPGFAILLKMNMFVDQSKSEETSDSSSAEQILRKRREALIASEDSSRTQVIFTTGPNSDSDQRADQTRGIVIYFTKHGELRATVKKELFTYSVDLPASIFEDDQKDTVHNVFVYWSQTDGLWIAYKGQWFDSDRSGTRHGYAITKTSTQFCVGGPCTCNKHQYFSGHIAGISIYDNLDLDPEEPFSYLDFSCDYCLEEYAECDTVFSSCSCKSGSVGDGINFCHPDADRYTGVLPPAFDPVYKWPDTFEVEYSATEEPTFIKRETGDILLSRNVVKMEYTPYTVLFDGVHEYIDGGEMKDCFKNPTLCRDGLFVRFNMTYYGRGYEKNYIFSTGALSWYHTTGISMFVEDGLATVWVQTESFLYKAQFEIPIGVYSDYTIIWSHVFGLEVFMGAQEITSLVDYKEGTANLYGRLTIGQPSKEHDYFNGRFAMDSFEAFQF